MKSSDYTELIRTTGLRKFVQPGDVVTVKQIKGKESEILAKVEIKEFQAITSVSIGKVQGDLAKSFGYSSGIVAILGAD
jgi:hypothetical protein